jgi:Fe2+ transport system protein FeoA
MKRRFCRMGIVTLAVLTGCSIALLKRRRKGEPVQRRQGLARVSRPRSRR